jgi:hypothetical protein
VDLVVARTRDRYLNWCRKNGLNPKQFIPISRASDVRGRAYVNVWWTEPQVNTEPELFSVLNSRAHAGLLALQNEGAVPRGQDD